MTHAQIVQEYLDAMRAADSLYHARLARLQAECPHTEQTDWLQGYDTDEVLCRDCHRTLERRPGGLLGNRRGACKDGL